MPITNAKYKGRDVQLKLLTSPGVYTVVGGFRANSVSIGSEAIDVTDKQDDTFRKLLTGGNRTLGMSGSGLITNQAAFEQIRDAANSGTFVNLMLVVGNGKAYSGPYLVTSFELNGEYNGAQQFSGSFDSANTPFVGAADVFPTLDFQFAESGSIQPTIGSASMTFTRSTSAVYRDVDGYIKTAGVNVPRFEYDANGNNMGYLPEAASTNLLLRSQELDNAPWSSSAVTVAANAAVAPDGTATSENVFEAAATTEHYLQQAVSVGSLAVNAKYSLSVFVKSIGRKYFRLRMVYNTGANDANVDFNLETGQVQGGLGGFDAAYITPYRDGYYRVAAVFTTPGSFSGITNLLLRFHAISDALTNNYAGDVSKGFSAWGAQLEAQPQATSYIATAASQVTRTADSLSCTTASIAGFSAATGSILAEFYQPSAGQNDVYAVSISDGTVSNSQIIFVAANNSADVATTVVGGSNQAALTNSSASPGSMNKIAYGWAANNFAASFRGSSPTTDTNGSVPSVSNFFVGGLPGSPSNNFTRPIKRISYYNTRISNAALQALTG